MLRRVVVSCILSIVNTLYIQLAVSDKKRVHEQTMRVPVSLSLTALSLVSSSVAYPFADSEEVFRRDLDAQKKADAVKEAFQHAWDGYMKYAYPHDELHPVSNGYGDSR